MHMPMDKLWKIKTNETDMKKEATHNAGSTLPLLHHRVNTTQQHTAKHLIK